MKLVSNIDNDIVYRENVSRFRRKHGEKIDFGVVFFHGNDFCGASCSSFDVEADSHSSLGGFLGLA